MKPQKKGEPRMQKITSNVWNDRIAKIKGEIYLSVLPSGTILSVTRRPRNISGLQIGKDVMIEYAATGQTLIPIKTKPRLMLHWHMPLR